MGSVARMKFLGLVIGLSLYLSACRGGGGSSNGPGGTTQPSLSSITVTPATVTLITGQTQQLTATANYSDGSAKDVSSTAAWSSSNAAVATVSSGGLLTSVTAGQVNISAALTGVTGTDAVTVNAKALAAIQLSPTSATLATGISQQFFAIGTYNDGSISQLTQGLTWASSVPGIASMSATGVVTTQSQGSTTVSATSGSIEGSINLVVNGSSGGPVIVDDLTDSRILIATGSDQSSLTYFGIRDSNGIPTTLTGIRRQAIDGTWQDISIDSQGRPTSIVLSDNARFDLNWTSNTSAGLTAITADGRETITAPLGPKAFTAPATAAATAQGMDTSKPQASTAASTGPVVSFNVSTCGMPEQFAKIGLVLADGNIPATLVTTPLPVPAGGPALYQANVASGATQNITALIGAMPKFLGNFCSFVGGFDSLQGGTKGGLTLGAAICGAAVGAAFLDPLAAPLVAEACGPAGAALATAVATACQVSNNSGLINSVINFITEPASIFWLAQLPSTSVGSPIPQRGIVYEQQFPGGYPTVIIQFECPNISKVGIIPPVANIPPTIQFPVLARAFGPDNVPLASSTITYSWQSNDTTVVTVPTAGVQLVVGTRNNLTGLTSGLGRTTEVLATESRSNAQGNTSISVCQGYCTLDYPGSNGSTVAGINNNTQIVGWYFDQAGNRHGVFYGGGNSGSFDYNQGATDTAGQGISDYYQVVGYYVDQAGIEHGFLYGGGPPLSIDYPGSTGTQAAGINNGGQFVGHYVDQAGHKHGFLYSGGNLSSLDYPGATDTLAYAINSSGQIVGVYYDQSGNEHGFLNSSGAFSSIDVPGATTGTSAEGINDSGHVVGHYFDAAGAHGFFDNGGSFVSLDYPAATDTRACGINNDDVVVGMYYDQAGKEHGFVKVPAQ